MYTLDFLQMIMLLQKDLYPTQILEVNPLICQNTDQTDALLNQVAVLIPDEEQKEQSITTLWSDQSLDQLCIKLLQDVLIKNEITKCLLRRCPGHYFKPYTEDILWQPLEDRFIFILTCVLIFFSSPEMLV